MQLITQPCPQNANTVEVGSKKATFPLVTSKNPENLGFGRGYNQTRFCIETCRPCITTFAPPPPTHPTYPNHPARLWQFRELDWPKTEATSLITACFWSKMMHLGTNHHPPGSKPNSSILPVFKPFFGPRI